ncbi:pentapeptide repeat-containing protein [bacterium]|nr:pentapeptide repeat-containing protein [bacterium]
MLRHSSYSTGYKKLRTLLTDSSTVRILYTSTLLFACISLIAFGNVTLAMDVVSASDELLRSRKLTDAEQNEMRRICGGNFVDRKPSHEELKIILQQHKKWLAAYDQRWDAEEALSDDRRANLCGADLSKSDLRGADLRYANLSFANLTAAKMSQAILSNANLSGITAHWTKLADDSLIQANLANAVLPEADLSGTTLTEADLSYANLVRANLKSTGFFSTILVGAWLNDSNLEGVVYELKNGADIDVSSIGRARGLSKLIFSTSPVALVQLRDAFKKSGLRKAEREVTYAIKHTQTLNLMIGKFWFHKYLSEKPTITERLEGALSYVFFDFTTKWGLAPGRALYILLILVPFFAIPYMFAVTRSGRDGIWRVWEPSRIRQDLGGNEPVRIQVGWTKALVLGFYFSILSALSVGWRDINIGYWMARVQPKEYSLRATGWVKAFSGVQSLISLYLLAIWALTYFGRPFE